MTSNPAMPAFLLDQAQCKERRRQVRTVAWPLQSYLELGALPGAVPSARLHARLVVCEWGLHELAETTELIASELTTNAVQAARGLALIFHGA